jgi:hypothetical protein
MIHSFTVTFGAKYLTGMVTNVPPYETISLIKNNILLHSNKNVNKICSYETTLQFNQICVYGYHFQQYFSY